MKSSPSSSAASEEAYNSSSMGASSETCAASSSSSSHAAAAAVSAVTNPSQYRRKPPCSCRSESIPGCSACLSSSSLQRQAHHSRPEHETQRPIQQAQSSYNGQNKQVRSYLSTLSQHLVTAARHHVALGALHYQRCSYRAATEHYQRSIAFLMRREDALSKYDGTKHNNESSQDDEYLQNNQAQPQAGTPMAAKPKLAVEIEKMEFYTHVLCLNNSSDLDLLQRQQQQGQGSHQLLPFKYDLHIDRRDPKKRRRPLPPRRLSFYLDQYGASYALDSHMGAHQVLPPSSSSVSSSPSSQQSQSHSQQPQTLHLLKAYVMHNLALCHVALGSYAESLNLLRMVLDDDNDGPYDQHQHQRHSPHHGHGRQGGSGIPIELVKVIEEYQAFVRQVLQVQRAASSSNAAAPSTTSAEEGQAESMDIDAAEAGADGIDVKATATTDEDGPALPASAA